MLRVSKSARARALTHLQDEKAVVVEVDPALAEQLRDLRSAASDARVNFLCSSSDVEISPRARASVNCEGLSSR